MSDPLHLRSKDTRLTYSPLLYKIFLFEVIIRSDSDLVCGEVSYHYKGKNLYLSTY